MLNDFLKQFCRRKRGVVKCDTYPIRWLTMLSVSRCLQFPFQISESSLGMVWKSDSIEVPKEIDCYDGSDVWCGRRLKTTGVGWMGSLCRAVSPVSQGPVCLSCLRNQCINFIPLFTINKHSALLTKTLLYSSTAKWKDLSKCCIKWVSPADNHVIKD